MDVGGSNPSGPTHRRELCLGFIGVHRFMRGQVGLGILYILTFGLFGFGTLIDFIISLVKLGSYHTDYYEFSYVPNGQWVLPSQG